MQKIYVKLLEEGTTVFRPVLAKKVSEEIYQLIEMLPPVFDDEQLEFPIGTEVIVEYKPIDTNENCIVAIKKAS